MASLNTNDRNKLLNILEQLPVMNDFRGRRMTLISAGLENITPNLNLEGSPIVVLSELIFFLESFGRLSIQNTVLGIYLNTVKQYLGSSSPEVDFINSVINSYNLLIPEKNANKDIQWNVTEVSDSTFEKIIGENTLKHIVYLQKGIELSKSVALIDTGEGYGTGFLVAPNFVITNNHVINSQTVLSNSSFIFNYQINTDNKPEQTLIVLPKIDGVFHTNEELDYTIVEIETVKDYGYIQIMKNEIKLKERVCIIQHPNGLYKKISFQNNILEYVDNNFLQYLTSTLPGSSGSPVFNDDWKLIGLHHAGGYLHEPNSLKRYFRNEGININAIIEDMPEDLKKKLIIN